MPTFSDAGDKRRLSHTLSIASGASFSRRQSVESANSTPENDDQAEKLAALLAKKHESRRRSAALVRSASAEEAVINVENRKNPESVQLSNSQLADLYSSCMKLCAENKINMKNSWGLRLIDHMDELVQKAAGSSNTETNFQVASCTLDAGVKIYAYRVDSVHNEAYKVLGGLSRGDGQGADQDDEDDEDGGSSKDDQQVHGNAKASRKNISQTGVNTLETNVDNINCKKFDVEFSVDPLFRKTSAAFDEGGAKGLLLNRLDTSPFCEVIFDSSEIAKSYMVTQDSFTQDAFSHIPGISDIGINILSLSSSMELCPPFVQYLQHIGEYPSGGVISPPNFAALKEFETKQQTSLEAQSPIDAIAPGFDDGPADFDAEPMANADSSSDYEDCLEDPFNGVSEAPEPHELTKQDPNSTQAIFNALNPNVNAKPLLVEALLTAPEDLPYLEQLNIRSWAGPGLWRYKNPQTIVDVKEKAKPNQKPKKGSILFDFGDEAVPEVSFAKPERASTTLSDAALAKNTLASTTLPRDIRYDARNLTKLFTRDSWVGSSEKIKPQEVEAGEFYDYNNANDMDNYCPDLRDDDSIGEHDDYGSTNDTPSLPSGTLELVDAPQRVSKIEINYATKAKQVDVKVVKQTIWNELQQTASTKQTNAPQANGSTSFQGLLESLSERLPSTERQNTSVPIAFICLLHLANEKGLALHSSEGMDSLSITIPNSITPAPCPLPRK